jgi:hypothetical protein
MCLLFKMFWAAVCELTPSQVRHLLRCLLPAETEDSVRGQVLYGGTGAPATQLVIHILPPTAVALLSPDVSEIVVFPERSALALPRYSNMHALTQHLLQIVNI